MAYVSDGRGGWSLTCLSCHGGKVAGKAIAGLGNSHFAFKTLTDDVIRAWMLAGGKPAPWQLSRLTAHLGASNGTIDAQVFSIQLTALRDDDMNVRFDAEMPPYAHHDLDAPPLWNVRKKKRLYIDGFAEKSPRAIMQFTLYPENDAATVKSWEPEFADVLAWIESLEPPKYPFAIDRALAARGEPIFKRHVRRMPRYVRPGRRVSGKDRGDRRREHRFHASERHAAGASPPLREWLARGRWQANGRGRARRLRRPAARRHLGLGAIPAQWLGADDVALVSR